MSSTIRDRLKRSREQTPQPAQPEPPASMRVEIVPQQARREQDRSSVFARIERHRKGYERVVARYGGTPPVFVTSHEARAAECWRLACDLGLVTAQEHPRWVRKAAWS